MATVTFDHAERVYPGSERAAVDDFSLDVGDGEFMVLVGPSGCGKSTSLRMLAGLEEVTSGEVRIDGVVVNDVPPKDRDIAMVFQSYALYPHMTVGDNMAFALKLAGVPKAERRLRVAEAAAMLDLTEHLDRKPRSLSGGQRQRVAMGRAIVRQPRVFCMDEPLSNLDAKLRVATRTQIAALQQRLGTTTVYVTHDQVEAMTMGDRVAVMKDGVLQQVDTPLALYDRPANLFVAGFIGSPAMNLLEGRPTLGGVEVDGFEFAVEREAIARAEGEVTIGVRPEDWRLATDGEVGYPVTVTVSEELGADAYLYATPAAAGAETVLHQVVARIPGRMKLAKGETVRLVPTPGQVSVFDTASGERLSA
ncbi:ABC transporter ATP-binding protein [Nocardioides jishulii]|uniref:sn-glycerol-3-phosphate ABC transporter ATP-binding protein UgpC n=1 Tax=Nocardioides jishulii TaxID=2575440 RepID=A0A4U2YIB4_9ACTN|nr:sn-glycerol-3-phosphate ABC transporter ATP-binding protein UgpC [Nocardioides jishulii]QCX26637.1 sn-glycerol-3-phosphate ABC transporter ATP-binding protein UgpC [Nocardioides jishulii]TKI60394.1 sn-glycerol-3-phosphate ABC transporter ATP-binding protein UgpC [Nocardioides jishulii]